MNRFDHSPASGRLGCRNSLGHRAATWIAAVAIALPVMALAFAPRAFAADAMDHSKMSHAAMAAGPSFALGSHHHAISTHSVAAQKRFDEGLNWMWAFNVQEAQRSFEAAAKLDPTCAMCWWGVALSLGPHINVPALPDRTVEADKAVKKAVALESHASAEEKALIAALTHRYSDPAPTDPAKQHDLDQGYSDAMRAVSKQYPKDLDVEALYVESMLDLRPWDYWTADGKPQPGTEEIVGHLEHILAIDPTHPGANHYYIHAIEESPHPEKALAAAHRLENLMPGSGHMTHMPFHIYLRVGQYARAENVNQKAVEADLAYKKSVEVPMFMYMYTAHDYQSLSFCQMMQGKSEAAVKNARAVLDWVAPDMARQMPGVDFFLGAHDYTLARFGKWDEIQSAPPPPDGLPYLNGVRHYVRGLAFAARGDFPHAKAEKDSVSAIKGSMPPDLLEDLNSAKALLEIAEYSLAGEIAARQNETDDALAMLTKAVAAEDALHYSEPPDWQNPTRLQLGDVLMAAGQAKQAEAVYRAELAAHPEDPWGLHGLAASLRGQQKSAEAAEAEKKFAEGWAGADIQLKGTRF